MPDSNPQNSADDIRTAVEKAVPKLKVLSAVLDTYGDPKHAETVRDILSEFERVLPSALADPSSTDFMVKARFRVTRMQVASLLSFALAASTRCEWCSIVEMSEPAELRFRTHKTLVLRLLDYPLNEGGLIGVSAKSRNEIFRLDLETISRGLEVMASSFPRHFADFLNETADAITADVFLQCCLFGEVVYE